MTDNPTINVTLGTSPVRAYSADTFTCTYTDSNDSDVLILLTLVGSGGLQMIWMTKKEAGRVRKLLDMAIKGKTHPSEHSPRPATGRP